jgi:elongation factor Ts
MNISASDVKALRDRTGAGMMDCKAALIEAKGDAEEAITILRKKGMAQVAKKAGRAMKEGLVGVRLDGNATHGVIAEINCESDFVARTNDFQSLVAAVTSELLGASESDIPALIEADGAIGQKVGAAIAKLGENMAVSRANSVGGNGLVGSYLHQGGKIGVLVELAGVPEGQRSSEDAQRLVREVAMQIAAASPGYATRAEVPADVIEKEKAVYRAQMENSGKPANVIEKIVEGKLGSFYAQTVLAEQPSIRDPKMTVTQVIAEASKALGAPVHVTRFVRYKVGEAS